jgi:hypothetical protein
MGESNGSHPTFQGYTGYTCMLEYDCILEYIEYIGYNLRTATEPSGLYLMWIVAMSTVVPLRK